MTAISYALLWIPYLVGQLPLLVCAFVLALAVVVGCVGNSLVRGATRGATGAHRLGALAGRYAVVGAGIGAATGGAMAYASPSFAGDRFVPTILLSALCYPAFAVVAAAAKTGFRRLAAIESELAAATDQATASAAEAQNKLIVARRRVAHLLHSDVQAECSAAARSLRASHTLTESDWTTVLARIESAFDRPRLGVHGNDAQQTLDGVLGAWRFSMDITVTADPRVWARLDADASRLELAIDIIAEALTNTIRHGTELRARIALDPSPSARGILVAVESAGRLDERGRRDGHGLAQLASRARCLSLTQERSDVILRVEIA